MSLLQTYSGYVTLMMSY